MIGDTLQKLCNRIKKVADVDYNTCKSLIGINNMQT